MRIVFGGSRGDIGSVELRQRITRGSAGVAERVRVAESELADLKIKGAVPDTATIERLLT